MLCLYLSAHHVEEVQSTLMQYYPAQTPVLIGYRISWPEQWIHVVDLKEISQVSKERKLTRTTLYIISKALHRLPLRSRLYSPDHDHLFRPKIMT